MKKQTGRDTFNKYENIIVFISKMFGVLPRKIRNVLFVSFRNIKGKKGILLRYVLLKTLAKKVGKNVAIHENVYLLNVNELVVGTNVSIHPQCYIECFGSIEIGDDVSIAHNTTIMSVEHKYTDENLSIKYQGIEKVKTSIRSNVWIGAKAIILAGVTVMSGSIVGAGAVVTKDVDENTIVVGNPAHVLKKRVE